ncbi:hypothetical protein [Micromonospora sp. NPDC049891]|uniref:hypothetical protein n=1 Tax=Micromonospora sp. NPDC049891 TaxID=3155655 RepID=UPI0033FC6B77
MAVHSKQSRVVINDSHVSGRVTGWGVSSSRTMAAITGLLDEGARYVPGLASGEITLNGVFDADPGALVDQAQAAAGVDNGALVTVLPAGFAIGGVALGAVTDVEGIDVTSTVTEAVSVAVSSQADDGVDLGYVLHGADAETASGTADDVDGLLSSANGGVGTLHVLSFTGLDELSVTIQHSADGDTWADLVTFTPAADKTAERLKVSGTVSQYLRATWTADGTGSAGFVVTFSRR